MSVWIQSLFSALLPLPHKLMWQKTENHEWLCLRLVWSTVTYSCLVTWRPRRRAYLSLGGKKGWFSLTARCSARAFVFPGWGGARSRRSHLRHGGRPWGLLHAQERVRRGGCCPEVPARRGTAPGEAGARPAAGWERRSLASFISAGWGTWAGHIPK